MWEAARYVMAGAANTLVGYLVYWLCLSYIGLTPAWANAVGYAVGLCVAFVLNQVFVFRGSRVTIPVVFHFLIAFAVAFALNQLVLWIQIDGLEIAPEIAQIGAMMTYTVSFFLLNKFLVFRHTPNRE